MLHQIPIREIRFETPAIARDQFGREGRSLFRRYLGDGHDLDILTFVEARLEDGRTDVLHDLLAHLAQQMIDSHSQRLELEHARDPFKYLDRDVPFRQFGEIFADPIKYGQRLADLDVIRHDIDALSLTPADSGGWKLDIQLKLRDPAGDWQPWQYEEDGRNILRKWITAYRFPTLDADKARYYRYALPFLDEFNNASSFPGGYTRTTARKLRVAKVPVYDPTIDLSSLFELDEELSAVYTALARTDALIDQIVYRLYGLTDHEIAIIEGNGP